MRWGIVRPNTKTNYDLDLFGGNIDRIFNNFFDLKPFEDFKLDWSPSIDVEEDKNFIKIKAEVPGIEEKDLQVSLENNVLTISGEKKEEIKKDDKKGKAILTERKFGSFSRSISVPEDIKSDKIEASYKNGILTLILPKDEAKAPKKIDIKIQ